jgi:ketosteroid isomerase-like protein
MEKSITQMLRSGGRLCRLGLLAGTTFSALAVGAQTAGAQPGSVDEIKKTLIQTEREIGQANFDCDYKYFARVEADEFIFTDPNGEVTTKKDDLAGEKDCHKFGGTYDLDETQVHVYGNTAVVTARVTIAGKNKAGNAFVHHSRFTDVFVWRDRRWQIVAGHSSKIPEANK